MNLSLKLLSVFYILIRILNRVLLELNIFYLRMGSQTFIISRYFDKSILYNELA